MINNIVRKLRRIPLGGWVLVALAFSLVIAASLKTNAEGIRSALLGLRKPPLNESAQAVLWRGESPPQGFAVAPNADTAQALLTEMKRADKVDAARSFLRLDFLFMAAYGSLLTLGA